MTDDLISRSALIAAYDAAHKGPPGGARKLMENAPAVDAVEVIRCKDCMFFDREAKSATRDLHRCKITGLPVFGYDFCSDGELKNDAEDTQTAKDALTCGPDYCEIEGDGHGQG